MQILCKILLMGHTKGKLCWYWPINDAFKAGVCRSLTRRTSGKTRCYSQSWNRQHFKELFAGVNTLLAQATWPHQQQKLEGWGCPPSRRDPPSSNFVFFPTNSACPTLKPIDRNIAEMLEKSVIFPAVHQMVRIEGAPCLSRPTQRTWHWESG